MFTIAHNTIRELVRNKFFSLILFLGVVFIALSFALKTLALGELERVLYDFWLSFIELTGLAVILFLGWGMIAREIEGRTIFLMLSKPISRSSIFLGKFLGFASVVVFMVAFQTALFYGLLSFQGFSLDTLFFPAILGIVLKLLALLAVILFFSSFTSPMIAMFLTIAVYMIGHSGFMMLDYARSGTGNESMRYLGELILTIFPNLESLNLKNYVAIGAPVDLMTWYKWYGLALLYILVLLFLGAWIFRKKSFDNA